MGIGVVLENVWFSYDTNPSPVLRGINLVLNQGHIYGLMGPNASGKTTLLKTIALLLRPYQGRVLINGEEPWKSGVERFRGRVVYVHEKPIIIRGTVYRNIAIGLQLRGASEDIIMDRIERVATLLDLKHLLSQNARHLSMGQSQLVAIARALVLDPMILALDEAFSNLDSTKRRLLAGVVRSLVDEGKLVIVSSHDGLFLSKIADDIIYMEEGQIKLIGDANSVLNAI